MLRSSVPEQINFGEDSKQVNEYERARHNLHERHRAGGPLRKKLAVSTLDDAALARAKAAHFRRRFEAG